MSEFSKDFLQLDGAPPLVQIEILKGVILEGSKIHDKLCADLTHLRTESILLSELRGNLTALLDSGFDKNPWDDGRNCGILECLDVIDELCPTDSPAEDES